MSCREKPANKFVGKIGMADFKAPMRDQRKWLILLCNARSAWRYDVSEI
jgi:hypothetical protein